jgi:lipopolysaccharide biosynthesis glycosyltransferase
MKTLYSVLLSLKKPDEYFCGALTVFNIEAFRQTISTEKLFELAASREWQVHDQDVLNVVAEGKTLLLPFHWNNFNNLSWAKYLPDNLKAEYDDAKENPKVLHFKPWGGGVFHILSCSGNMQHERRLLK